MDAVYRNYLDQRMYASHCPVCMEKVMFGAPRPKLMGVLPGDTSIVDGKRKSGNTTTLAVGSGVDVGNSHLNSWWGVTSHPTFANRRRISSAGATGDGPNTMGKAGSLVRVEACL